MNGGVVHGCGNGAATTVRKDPRDSRAACRSRCAARGAVYSFTTWWQKFTPDPYFFLSSSISSCCLSENKTKSLLRSCATC